MRTPTKDVTITVRTSKALKAIIVSEAKKDKRKVSQFCDILLAYGLEEHLARKNRAKEVVAA